MSKPTDERTLAEIEGVIRSFPPRDKIGRGSSDVLQWLGRASAALHTWNAVRSCVFPSILDKLGSGRTGPIEAAYRELQVLMHQAQNDLRFRTVGPVNVAIGQGQVFQYFDQLRQVIEQASTDILFVDPYMEAEFVSRYLPHVKAGVTIRLLGRKSMAALVPAVALFAKEHSAKIEVRSAASLHDRYVFLDQTRCFQSGASFKDGAVKSGTTLTENVDAFGALQTTYEGLWSSGTVQA